ncbi:hypothetical protein HG535_0E03620 [Zygotorulaspora mrakii]|uniref:Pre-mRNA-splicing factor 18 n=1 Tax=Zygotorulaspora mrakii TaxID=42260 RepID=A0A7H9B3P0_ZYGMR|nr:uncharacterized protein HG535_0E03620 [Zygotorulaspora mrakii]QLG73278.1 hypothetical protein HG535_0E03620 [Zygotorulaspora mrakii]
MSFDISSFLKNEITKKTEQLKYSTRPDVSTVVQDPSQDETDVKEESPDDDSDSEGASAGDNEELMLQLERLKTRPTRINETIERDANSPTTIDVMMIGVPEKLKYVSLQCNGYIHKLLDEWEICRDKYHGELLIDTKKCLFPLLVQLRKGTLAKDLVVSLATVLYHLQQSNQNTRAIESYMKLSIGNIAWPIGVTSIGIHARSANSKIQGGNGQIANIMLDDRTRLWITSIKRLITFKEWLDKHMNG